ncbi:helix-turn-helix domain-containing protein [Roseobacter sp. HKCCD9010]|uniref:IclR family transcriptional regulator domain-containing protein n=1 Tax=Rhodobacterales TaxID=204455 RepID=UPI00149256F9|nr:MULTISPECIES: IclR family transcriptional regulator C-terminal domain-containing protein [Rhodobacterales]MBF9050736.1 helix-turn-helix domain-containing protein [Rhodobacterales bacterium HKCCD4356]NNV11846.1 helix-turn-helix domain-containing protein [Roseobacter sp. HKCCD7357]NNV17997.1 helix-turn-helix domain-containing protein [Roseobacter sp. HKCCD8768]NNV26088.1 helix-turn-helix domain-containing protein [Roseobacter sp. HKCCD8192]NNV31724.1 helix-turn-helix domain-containing protein
MAKQTSRNAPSAVSENRLGTVDPEIGLEGEEKLSSRDFVSSLSRGLSILNSFSQTSRKMTLSQVAAETGMSRATARRFLLTLVKEGYVVTDGKMFDLTPKVLDLGFSVLSTIGVWDRARPFMERLSDQTGESVSAAILDGLDVVYVAGVQAHNIISVGITVGSRISAFYTANGRVLLAAQPEEHWDAIIKNAQLIPRTPRSVTKKAQFREILADVRQKGWSLVDQELELGLLSIAIPLHYRSGVLAGSINIAIPSVRATPEDMVEIYLPQLQDTADQIQKSLAR